MNRKGEMKQVGLILALFIGVVVALSLYAGGITSNIGLVTNTLTKVNESFTFPANTSYVLTGQAASSVVVINSSGFIVPANNYTITNYDISTGTLRSTILNTIDSSFQGKANNNITYVYEPLGYAQESSTRSVVGLIAIFAALAVLAYAIYNIYENGLFDSFR